MNPEWHDEFVALCAHFPSGELTEEEWALLQIHLAYCESCRSVFEQYQHITNDVMPVLASNAIAEHDPTVETASFSIDAAEQRLMSQLCSFGAERAPQRRGSVKWKISAGILAASLIGLIGLTRFHIFRLKHTAKTQAATPLDFEPRSRPELPHNLNATSSPNPVPAQLKVAQLQQQLSAAEEKYKQASTAGANLERQLETEDADRNRISREKDALSQQLTAALSEAQSLRESSQVAGLTNAHRVTETATLEAKLREVSAALEEKDRMLVLDKELFAHDREIRDLIGARNLYIADIYDVAQNGQTAKPFGRVFYTKDRSLVFYGYDLDKQAGLKQSVAFQAWGSGDDKQNVSLGLFYQDESHKRWVLHFDDTKTLARLKMVFVTAEPQGGSARPTGKPLLLAYLQVQPNHP